MKIDEQILYKYIGARLHERRLEVGLTQGQVATLVGVLRTSVTNIEAGRQKPPLHLLYALCLALGIEITSLLPSVDRVVRSGTVPLQVNGVMELLPPKTALFLKEVMEEAVDT